MPKPTTYYDSNLLTLSEIAWLRENQREAQAYYQKELDRMEAEEAKAAAASRTTTSHPTPKGVGYVDLADSTETAILETVQEWSAKRQAAASQTKTAAPTMTESADQSQPAGTQIPALKADRSEES